jgi:Ca-activated chloride channel family protein
MKRWTALLLAGLAATPARACDVALLLAIDVSGSVDPAEYRLQVDGTADALADPTVALALAIAEARIAIVQWSGAGQQAVVLSWVAIDAAEDAIALSEEARALSRVYYGSDTAVGDAIAFSAREFDAVPECRRKVIDISGDGQQNAGGRLAAGRDVAIRAGIEINAIAIEDIGIAISEFYRRHVTSEGGFVLTAQRHMEYPQAIRMKLLREIEKPAF